MEGGGGEVHEHGAEVMGCRRDVEEGCCIFSVNLITGWYWRRGSSISGASYVPLWQ